MRTSSHLKNDVNKWIYVFEPFSSGSEVTPLYSFILVSFFHRTKFLDCVQRFDFFYHIFAPLDHHLNFTAIRFGCILLECIMAFRSKLLITARIVFAQMQQLKWSAKFKKSDKTQLNCPSAIIYPFVQFNHSFPLWHFTIKLQKMLSVW